MALVLTDRVKESCTSPGTGTVTLLGAATEYQSFSAGIGANNTTYYTIADQAGSNWEVGLGTVGSGGTTLARTTVLASSNSGSLVNFSSGTQDVWCDYPAEKAVYKDASGNISNLAGSISAIDAATFNTSYATTLTAGQLGWDGNNNLGLGMAGGNVIQRIGEDAFVYAKASSAITKGQLCMFTGAVGASSVVTAAPSTGVTNAQTIIGIAAESIALNGFGLIQVMGNLKGFDTSAFSNGDILYYDSANTGGMTNTYPTSGPIVTVAAVTNSGSGGSGSVQIRISVTQRLTASTGISVSQTSTGTTITNTSPSSGGTVTSVAASVPSFLSVSGSPITSSGTLAITYSGTALPAANGGTGLTSPGTSGNVLTSNGTGWVSSAPTAAVVPITINSTEVTSNQTIATGTNGFSVGPMTIDSGVTVIVSSGQRWVVI